MSFGKGTKLFGKEGKNVVKLLTIVLLSAGIITASLFAYQQFTKPRTPSLISKNDATQIAFKAGNWNEQTLRDKKIETTLLDVKENGFSFKVDEKTMQDILPLGGKFPEYEKHQYIWEIRIIAPNNNDWVYRINAETGDILLQPPYR